jgi:Zn-dependent M16 (insulinase) family peptidase
MKVAASGLNQRNCIDEETGGLTQAFFMSELSESDKLDLLASQLKEMSLEILSTPPQSWRMAVVCANEADATNPAFVNFASSIHRPGPSSSALANFDMNKPNVLVTMPFSTNFTAKVYQFNSYDLKTSAHLALLSKIFRSRYLHREIREKGGAYGGGANYSTLNGLFSFYSYRDPNPLNSLKCFDSTINWFEGYQLTEQEVLEAQLSVISALDAPADVESEGMHSFWYGISDVDRQLYRDQVFTVTKESLKQLALDCFANGTPSRSCVIGEAEKEEELKDLLLSRAGWELKKFKI